MNKKSMIYILTIIFAIIQANTAFAITNIPERVSTAAVSLAQDEDNIDSEETDIIKRVSLRDKFRRSPEAQINSFFKAYDKYSSKNNIEKLKGLYSESFINNDGFDKETVFKLMQMSADTYKEIKYSTNIQSIKIDGNYAVVKVHEVATGETLKPMEKVGDTGFINSDIYYTDYLRKEDNRWKLLSNVIDYEKVDLKYGEAKTINVEINAPEYISEGKQYEITMKTNTPSEMFLVGSIVNEEITYPQKSEQDVYKAIKNDELSRLVYANKDNKNEYATVSLAITRAKVEPDTLVLNMTGIAFVMKRVNVLHLNKVNIEKEDKNAKEEQKQLSVN